MATSIVYGFTLIYMVTLSIVYRVACLIYVVSLDHKDFSSMPYSVTYSNMVYDTSLSNLVYVYPLGHII